MRAFVATASKRSLPCVSPIVASPTRSLTSTSAPRGTVTLILRLSALGSKFTEKLNHLCQSQTDPFSLELDPSLTTVPSSWWTETPLTRGLVPAMSTVTGPPSRTFTVRVPTMSVNRTPLPPKVLVGQTVQSPFAAAAGRIRRAATAAPPRNDLPRLFIGWRLLSTPDIEIGMAGLVRTGRENCSAPMTPEHEQRNSGDLMPPAGSRRSR